MQLRQQIIEDRIAILAKSQSISPDYAFLLFAHSLVTNQSLHAFVQTDLVDGGSDKQIDAITIEHLDEKETAIYILQAKNTTSFSSNNLIQMHNGLYWIFNAKRAEVDKLPNVKFRDKILEVRSERNSLGPSNIHVTVAFVTNGLTENLSDEFLQEERAIRHEYDNGTFASFDLRIWGADELVSQLNMIEKKDRKINADIHIKYDTNNPSLIKYHSEGLRGIVCTTAASEIARIVNNDPTGSVFDSNIRRFLGTRGAVNADIFKTCTEPTDSHQFWFLNNGITIVCESFDAVTDPDDPLIRLTNMQIVNGCQTATTLALAERNGELVQDTRVLLRIYQAPNSDLVDKIVITTNNQNKINSRDLKANDPLQIDMEQAFRNYNYFYERKPHQYDSVIDLDPRRILANEIVAQSYLAIILKRPVDARTHKQKVWGV
jgi:AIPR protein